MNWLSLLSEAEKRAAVAELATLLKTSAEFSDLCRAQHADWEGCVERVLARHGFARLTTADQPVIDLLNTVKVVTHELETSLPNVNLQLKPIRERSINSLRRAAADVEKLYSAKVKI